MKNGIKVASANPVLLADAALTLHQRPGLASSLGAALAETVGNLNRSEIAMRMLCLYNLVRSEGV
jgi:hypothetical protein